jgi:hypothetical protein
LVCNEGFTLRDIAIVKDLIGQFTPFPNLQVYIAIPPGEYGPATGKDAAVDTFMKRNGHCHPGSELMAVPISQTGEFIMADIGKKPGSFREKGQSLA